jgi:hypothetical protein
MTLPAFMNKRHDATKNDQQHTALKRKANHLEHPNRLSPEAYKKNVTDSPISPSRKRPSLKACENTDQPMLSLFDLATCLSESRDYDYPDRCAIRKPFVAMAFD